MGRSIMPPKGKIESNKELQERLDALENRKLKAGDLPMAALRRELAKEPQNPVETLLPHSIGPELLRTPVEGFTEALPSGTYAIGTLCRVKVAANVVWEFVYTGESPHPWTSTGNSTALREENGAQVTTASTSYTGLTGGPAVNNPFPGLYTISYGALMWNNVATGESYLNIEVNSSILGGAWYARVNNGAPTTVENHVTVEINAGSFAKHVYLSSSGGTLNAANRWIEIRPVRVG